MIHSAVLVAALSLTSPIEYTLAAADEPYFLRHVSQFPEGPQAGDEWMDSKESCEKYLPTFRKLSKKPPMNSHRLLKSYCISVKEANEVDGPDPHAEYLLRYETKLGDGLRSFEERFKNKPSCDKRMKQYLRKHTQEIQIIECVPAIGAVNSDPDSYEGEEECDGCDRAPQ